MLDRVWAHDLRIYYEDTDAQGIVYHANYLKYGERARAEVLRSLFVDRKKLEDADCQFVVANAELKYKKPAFLDDNLTVLTRIAKQSKVRFVFEQLVKRGDDILCEMLITVAATSREGRPKRLPEFLGGGV